MPTPVCLLWSWKLLPWNPTRDSPNLVMPNVSSWCLNYQKKSFLVICPGKLYHAPVSLIKSIWMSIFRVIRSVAIQHASWCDEGCGVSITNRQRPHEYSLPHHLNNTRAAINLMCLFPHGQEANMCPMGCRTEIKSENHLRVHLKEAHATPVGKEIKQFPSMGSKCFFCVFCCIVLFPQWRCGSFAFVLCVVRMVRRNLTWRPNQIKHLDDFGNGPFVCLNVSSCLLIC